VALLRFDTRSVHDLVPARRLIGNEFGIPIASGGGDIRSLRGQTFAQIRSAQGVARRGFDHAQNDLWWGGTRAGTRKAWFPEAGGYVEARVLTRQALAALGQITGPAIIEDPDSTAIILPGDAARISHAGHLIIDIAGGPS